MGILTWLSTSVLELSLVSEKVTSKQLQVAKGKVLTDQQYLAFLESFAFCYWTSV